MKRSVPAMILAFAMVLPAFAGGESEPAAKADGEKKVTLTLMDAFVPGEGLTKAYRAALDDFQKANPNVTIDEETISNADLAVKVKTLAAADELPDLFCLKGQMAESFVKNGKVLPLDQFLKKDPQWEASFKDGVFSNFLFDGKRYGIPYQITNTCVYYNEDLLRAAGVDSFPKTWTELVSAAKKIKAAGMTPIVLGNKDKWNAESVIMSTLGNRVSGNDWYQRVRSRTGAKFTDPEFVDALKALSELVAVGAFNTDVNSIDGAQQRQVFMNGKAAMTIDGTWAISDFDANCPADTKGKIRIAALPAVSGGKGDPQAISGGSGWAIAVNAKIDPAKLPAVEAFLKTVLSKKFATIQASTGIPTAIVPDAFELGETQVVAKKFDAFQKGRPYVPVYDHQLSSGVIEVMQAGLQELLVGLTTPEALARKIQAEYER